MKISYKYKGHKYIFVWFENEHGFKKICLVADPWEENERIIYIPCRFKAGISIGINKKSLSSESGAYGIIKFIDRATKNDLCTIYIDRIIERFALETA